MAAVPTSLLDELTDEVNKLSGEAQQTAGTALQALLSEWSASGSGDLAVLRVAAYEVINSTLAYYADTLAAARAAEYYDALRKTQRLSSRYSAVAESLRDPAATLGAVRSFIEQVKKGNSAEFLRLCLSRVDEETRRSANKCVAYNASKDPAKPRYARVPRGETCGFCLMLASFGFHYKTIKAAEHSHERCDCRIVPGFDSETTVKGYDPDGMYERYNSCLSALGGIDGLNADWAALPEEERNAYIAQHGDKESKARDAYYNKRIAAEITSRDPGWFKTGIMPAIG